MKKSVFLAELRTECATMGLPADKVVAAVQIALQRAKVIDAEGKPPRKIRTPKAKNLMTLPQWEAKVYGPLNVGIMDTWSTQKGLCKRLLAELIEEFRTEMVSKNKEYADFSAAFKTYLNKGYLSKTLEQAKLANSPYAGTVYKDQEHNRGVRI